MDLPLLLDKNMLRHGIVCERFGGRRELVHLLVVWDPL
jgi:hypothetical protein